MTERTAISGWKRNLKTARSVKVAEKVSRACITIGGVGTILAVATICFFLVWVVVPLFGGAEIEDGRDWTTAAGTSPAEGRDTGVLDLGVDEQQVLGWALLDDGRVVSYRVSDGLPLREQALFDPADMPGVVDITLTGGHLAAGYADGRIQLGRVAIEVDFLTDGEPVELVDLEVGEIVAWDGGLVTRTPELQLRRHRLLAEVEPPLEAGRSGGIALIDRVETAQGTTLVVLRDDDSLAYSKVRRRKHLFTGEITSTLKESELPFEARSNGPAPEHLLVSDLGDSVYVAWPDGLLHRYNVFDVKAPFLAETANLSPGAEHRLSVLAFLVGGMTLVAGDTAGTLRAWFPVEDAGSRDGRSLAVAHELPGGGAAVRSLAMSTRTRVFAAGFDDGRIGLYHMTSERLLAETSLPTGLPVDTLALAPRGDGLLAFDAEGARLWEVDNDHPESSMATLFTPVWYEGEPAPGHTWQSSGGEDAFEPKLGLYPLVFGTLKATFYAMLFSVPLAILAALYTSEFLPRNARARTKQIIEMMASLPSVVLGFLAALWLAPIIERAVPAALVAVVTVPLAWLTGAYLWQLLPQRVGLRRSGFPRLVSIGACVLLGLFAAHAAGPSIESLLFGGNVKSWLDGQQGPAFGGWLIMTLPVAALLTVIASVRWVSPWLRNIGIGWTRGRMAAVDMVRYAAVLGATLAVAALMAVALDGMGFDPRAAADHDGTSFAPFGTYVQRNALIVGFVMGFAVIPIIYTLAEDALSAVPDHLRAASLGAGATQWQTAVRVIMPTATSGLFSACMIGLGRAVGETMIVLMAAGNTPVMEANLFNGFRTLSATIAVELPEAVKDGTLYRVLFLSALTLFAMTFLINSLAELVRLRFRKKALEL